MKLICFYLLLLIHLFNVSSVPLVPKQKANLPPVAAFDFMRKYGYIPDDGENSAALYTEEGLQDVIKEIQKFGALPQTGELNNETLALMEAPRCGVADVVRKRTKRYILGPKGWNKRSITYYIANWSGKLSEEIVDKYIAMGLDTWGRYARLTFKRVYSPEADIIVAFGRGFHGDTYPFDGPGNILAHAFFPYEYESLGGDIHFDDDEDWTTEDDPRKGVNFFQVAIHELGHSLGLSHSPVQSSVMFPYYVGHSPTTLDYDDILGMYELYIRRRLESDDKYSSTSSMTTSPSYSYPWSSSTTTSNYDYDYSSTRRPNRPRQTPTPSTTSTRIPDSDGVEMTVTSPWYHPTFSSSTTSPSYSSPTTPYPTVSYHGDSETVDEHKEHDPTHHIPPTNTPSMPDICRGRYDAIATLRNELFVFKEQYLWRLRKEYDIVPGYPIPFRQMFPKLPRSVKRINAAYQRPDGRIVLFTGTKYWVYDGSFFIENSPKPLTDLGLPGTLERIDAVQNWARNGKTYFYRGNMFWRYDEKTQEMDPEYPKRMDRWRGVPGFLDAATTWRGVTYFFKGRCYWKFDNEWIVATQSSPLPTPQTWFGCPKEEKEYCVPSNFTLGFE